jgi:hypothetical protein
MRRVGICALATASLAVMLAGCGVAVGSPQQVVPATPVPQAHGAATVAPAATFVTPWPAGIDAPLHLAADPTRAGVWFWAADSTTSRLFFWNATTRTMQSWSVGASADLGPLVEAGLTVAPNGDVWAASQRTLLRLVPGRGDVQRWTLPDVAANPAASAYVPPSHAVEALAADVGGHVAIARDGAAAVQTFDGTSFGALTLPAGLSPDDVAYLPDGTLGVATTNFATHHADTAVVVSPDGSLHAAHANAWFVRAAGPSFVTGGGGGQPQRVTAAAVTAFAPASAASVASDGRAAAVTTDGRVVLPSKQGFVVVSPAGPTEQMALPAGTCAPRLDMVHQSPSAASTQCALAPLVLAADPSGNVWFVATDTQRGLGMIPRGSF